MIKKSLLKIVCLLIIIGLNWTGLLAVGKTFAFFSNNEDSNTNTFTAATLDFSLNAPGDFSPDLEPSQTISNRTIDVSKDGSLGFQYRVRVESATGGLCSHLELTDDLFGSSFQWLSSFVSGNTTFSNKSSWTFTARSSSFGPSLQGTICNFKLVFEGWQENIANYGDGGFSDTEEVESTIKMGYWNPSVVLNEFLPNAGNYPEFIEIYNKTASPIDLNEFYIKANGNIIPINTTTTHDYSGGSTEIPANGWLVVTAGGDKIDDSSGTVAFYNPNDVEVDSYTYDASDYNVNNTPGWTNNLVAYWPLDNDNNGIQDKSGNGNNGTDYSSGFVSGKINQALSFDGVDDYVEVADSIELNSTSALTAEGWIKTSSTGKWQAIVSKWHYNGNKRQYWLGINSSDKAEFFIGNGGSGFDRIASISIITDGNWHHIIGVYDGTNVKIFVDGVEENTKTTSVALGTSDKSVRIGASHDSNHYFNGLIDEVKIYDRALNAAETLDHFNAVGPSGTVPLDKSYARIPDGVDNWVDPIPTPGSPNRLSGGEIRGLGWQEGLTGEPISEDVSEGTPIIEESPVNEEIVSTEEIVSADEEVTTTTDETEDATTTEEATTTEVTATTEEIATTTNEIITTTTDELIITEETTSTEEIIIDEATTTEATITDENISEDETPVVDEEPATEEEPVTDGEPIKEETPADEVDETPADETPADETYE